MISIVKNRINVGFPQNQDLTGEKPHLVMKDDPRRRCAFIVGDGFTQGYLRHFGWQQEIPCSIGQLIAAPDTIPYLSTTGDIFHDSKFFTSEKWPKIFDAFSQGLRGIDFFKQVSKQRINPRYDDGLWSLNNNTIDYEIRCYLWHYFRSAHQKLQTLRNNLRSFEPYGWHFIFKTILEKFFLQIISFNYDLVAGMAITDVERLYPPYTINKRLFAVFKSPVEMNYNYYMNFYGPNEIPIVYIHGSWVNQISFPFLIDPFPTYDLSFQTAVKIEGNAINGDLSTTQPTVGFVANPWLDNRIEFVDNYFSTAFSQFSLHPEYFPMFPDIVPPGYQGHDKYNPYSKATETSRRILNDADLVIICGLSGREPDTEEVTDLLGNIPQHKDVIQVGLAQDIENPVAETLKKMKNIRWRFFDAITELGRINEFLKDEF